MTGIRIPSTGHSGIAWPALPSPADAALLALIYQFEQSEWWSPETLLAAQLGQLEGLLAHAARTVPFYRGRLQAAVDRGAGRLTLKTWRQLPILRRQDIQEAGAALISRDIPRAHGSARDISTSGSTGRPITVKNTEITRLFNRAVNLRYHLWHDRDFSATVASIRVLDRNAAKAAAAGKRARWAYGYPSGPMVLFDVTRPVSEQLAWLERQNPDYLLTYPSNLAALLRRSQETGVRPANLREAITLSEVLDPAVRAACKRVWKVPVTDSYSTQEFGMIALQCPEHPHYHVQAESALVEVLGPGGAPCAPGETGRLVVTPLNNFATPLIRYEVGDYAEVGEACSCGRGLPVLNRILGRVRNMATLPSGETFWPRFYSDDLAKVAPIRQAQLVQRSVHDIDVRLVVARALTAEEEERLKSVILRYLGHPFRLGFTYMDEIPRSASGKYEDFLSLIEP